MKKTFAIVSLLFGSILGVPLLIGVWLPDIFFAPKQTLAERRLTNGHSFQVIQYWNYADFYNTEFIHTRPDGSVKKQILDGDDSKSWSVPLVVDEVQKTVTVTLGGDRVKTIKW